MYLCNKAFHLRANPRTGGIILSISVIKIVAPKWVIAHHYWDFQTAQGAIFPPGFFLKRIYRYDVDGTVRLPFQLPPAEFTMSWRMAPDPEMHETTSMTATDGDSWLWYRRGDSFQCSTEDPAASSVSVVGSSSQWAEAGIAMSHHSISPLPVWSSMPAGTLDLRGEYAMGDAQSTESAHDDASSGEGSSRECAGEGSGGCGVTELEIMLSESRRPEWKRGVYVDALVLEQVVPGSAENTSCSSNSEQCYTEHYTGDPTISMDELMERLRRRAEQQHQAVASSKSAQCIIG